jgi:hypothetical protein
MAYLHIRADRHAGLELPSGKLAAKTRLSEVRNELARLKIDGITAASGKAELLDAFSAAKRPNHYGLRPSLARR